ncbi:hypothetical protein B0O99DRAFT_616150 [Bisporella sp. PMI_857]|nr:hypothetical protein B0O99DRAFT_616150 [Bisporella sp. PMI_857]
MSCMPMQISGSERSLARLYLVAVPSERSTYQFWRRPSYLQCLNLVQPYSWAKHLTIPHLTLIPYIADDPSALYHPPASKGREALIYLTYIHQFYDALPDISIFVHGDDLAWHIDPIFNHSTLNALNHLNLATVLERKYLNLRTSWKNACPDWINTTNGLNGSTSNIFFSSALHDAEALGSEKFEEPYMRAAFQENFPGTVVPEVLAQPCCSQFAVSREAIRAVERERYAAMMDWLLKTPLSDQLTGRMWEHMWQFLFLGSAVDCPVEYEVLCEGWGLCFRSQGELDEWNLLAGTRKRLATKSSQTEGEVAQIERLDTLLVSMKERAESRGVSLEKRSNLAVDDALRST